MQQKPPTNWKSIPKEANIEYVVCVHHQNVIFGAVANITREVDFLLYHCITLKPTALKSRKVELLKFPFPMSFKGPLILRHSRNRICT